MGQGAARALQWHVLLAPGCSNAEVWFRFRCMPAHGLPPRRMHPHLLYTTNALFACLPARSCNERGRCVDAGGGLPQCVCAPFFTGPSCQLDDPSHCPLNCSGRGRCDGGFCHCQAGWWGAACTRSKAYTAEGKWGRGQLQHRYRGPRSVEGPRWAPWGILVVSPRQGQKLRAVWHTVTRRPWLGHVAQPQEELVWVTLA